MSRRGKSRAANIIGIFFDGVLLLCFISQAFVLGCLLIFGDLPLPNQWTEGKINETLPSGVALSADSYSLHLDGTIQIENLRFQIEGIQQPVFHADYAHAEFGTEWNFDAPIYLKECVLSDGVLLLPAVYSPSGKSSTILDRIAMRFIPAKPTIAVDSFAALHEDIRLRGSIHLKTEQGPSGTIDIKKQTDLFFKQVSTVLKQKSRIKGLSKPTILFHITSSSDNGSLDIQSRISSQSYNDDNLQAKNLKLDVTLSLSGQTLVNKSSILLEADEIEMPKHNTHASDLSAEVKREDWEALLKGEWPDMEVAAKSLEIEKIQLKSPRIKLSPKAYPDITFDGLTSGLKGAVQFAGTVNVVKRMAQIEAAGSIDLLSITPKKVSTRLPVIKANRAPFYNLKLDFDEGFKLAKAKLRARVDLLEVDAIQFDHIRFRSSYDGGKYSIDSFYMRRDWQWLDLGLNLDSATNDYALTLKGFAKPYDYNAILPKWWGSIFREFDFEQVEDGMGDFVIYGNTKEKAADFFYGYAFARNVSYKDVPVAHGQLIVRGRGRYSEIHQLEARTGEGFVTGDIRFASRLDEIRGPMSVRLDLATQLPLSDAQKLFDQNISDILSDFETDALPRANLKGAIFNSAYPEFEGLSYIDISADCSSPITYKDIPMDYLSFDLLGRKGITYLRDITLGFAGGMTKAKADIITNGGDTAHTRFELSIEGANQTQAMRQLTKLQENENKNSADQEALGKGRLDLKLHAEGPINKPIHMNGFGSLKIHNEKLYDIQLFGPLSRLLQSVRLGFTSFALNEVEATFALDQGAINFQQLEITGPRTRIEAPGKMQLDDFSLAMRVSVYLFGNSWDPDSRIRKFGNFITRPIPNLLEFELTGTPDEQKWRSLYDPRKFIPEF